MNYSEHSREDLIQELQSLRQELAQLHQEKAVWIAQNSLLENLVTIAGEETAGGVLKAALQKTLDVASDLTAAEKGSMFLLDTKTGKVIDAILCRTKVTPEQRKRLVGNVLDKGLAGWVVRHQKLGLIHDTEKDDRWLTLPNQPYTVGSALAVPVIRVGKLLGIITLLHSQKNHFTQESATLMRATADQMALILENARLYHTIEEYAKALDHELEKGRQIQIDFLPYEIIQPPNWEIRAFFQPAKQVAGDFYDAFELGEYVGLVIADVCDKGVGAALFMALMRSLIRIYSAQTYLRGFPLINDQELENKINLSENKIDKKQIIPLEAIPLTNNYVAEKHCQMCMFATMFFGLLDPKTGIMTYINGGHESLFIIGKSGSIKKTLDSTGPAVGMMANMKFTIKQVQFEPGDILIGYTDGVTEGKNTDGKLFTDEKLKSIIQQPTKSASDLLEKIKINVFEHIGEASQFDDITLLAAQWQS